MWNIMKTRVSVIIPIYNVQNFLKESLDSILAQTIINLELTEGYERNLQIILIDDGSTDNSSEIAKTYVNEFENIEYHYYEESHGPGYARNFGYQFAEGDYIIFADSDDIVRPHAYERMYKSAIENGTDMVIGAVLRFNSKNYWRSYIHSVAFSGEYELTHITESPELIYDTTVWNKLIKRSFWEKYDFKFLEGVLYEDIPITFFLHYYANKISIINETCYLWRVRDGTNLSITQKISKIQNLKDRLNIMGIVDDFFKENVTQANLIHEKIIKWLSVDLMIFIQNYKTLSEEEIIECSDLIKDYITKNIDLEDLSYLNEIDQLKYEYLLDNKIDQLVNLVNFEWFDLKSTKGYYENSHLMIDVDEEIFGCSSFCIDKYIRKIDNFWNRATNVALKKNKILIEGFTVIPGLKDENFEDRKYSFFLVNSETHKRVPLKFKNSKAPDVANYKHIYGNDISYESSGYTLTIPFSRLINNEDFMGENRVEVIFRQKDVLYKYFVTPKYVNLENKKLKSRIYKNHYFALDYDVNKELILRIAPVDYCYEKVEIENNQLSIYSPNYNGDMFLFYEKNPINDEYKIPLEYDDAKHCYLIDVTKISKDMGQIRYGNGNPILSKRKKQLYLHSDKGQIIINMLRDYHFDICRRDDISLVSNISENAGNISIDVKLYSVNDISKLKSANLFIQDNKNYKDAFFSKGILSENNKKITFKFNLNNESLLKNIYGGYHDFKVVYELENSIFSTPLYLFNPYNYHHAKGLFKYKIYRAAKGNLRIKSSKEWAKHEDTAKKRLDSLNKYKLFRRLPINKKRVMFESLWGKDYNCNPRYFYEYINENYPDYECIWSLDDEHIRIEGNAKRVRKFSLKYYYYLATSKYLMDNVNFEDEYIKRDEQVYIQTMHGTPLKTFGLDIPTEFTTNEGRKNFIDRCARWDYLLVQSDYAADLSKRCFLYEGNLLKAGYPRTDILYSRNNEKSINELKERLGLPLNKKVILYAPTWRLRDKFDLAIDLGSFKKNLSDDYVLILRTHHFAGSGSDQFENDEFVYDFSEYNSMEELYLISDILISDYSSAMFDYAILDRPIILFAYDLEDYTKNIRGIYLDLEEIKPGPIVYTSKDLENTIININQIDEKYKPFRREFKERFNQYESENSSEQIFNVMTKDQKTNEIINKLKDIYSKIAYWIIKSV